jgi:hypothetical protein
MKFLRWEFTLKRGAASLPSNLVPLLNRYEAGLERLTALEQRIAEVGRMAEATRKKLYRDEVAQLGGESVATPPAPPQPQSDDYIIQAGDPPPY